MSDQSPRAIEFQDPLLGRVLQDRYRVVRLIGRGGMGVVYLAEHVLIQRKLAIKVLHSQWTASEELVQRFHREARAAAASGNEHVVDITDMGRLEDGTYYMVLEYLDGPDLAALVEREGPLSVARVLDIGMQLCEALGAVHAAGIVHRDLKPENIVLIRRNQRADFVKILDFGICKVFNELPLTATGVALGTPQFMAPEQLEARPEVDHRADVYAIGAILFFALTGRNLFDSESLPRLLVSIWSEPAPKLCAQRPDAPEALERLIAHALEKHPDRRIPDVRQFGAALSEIASTLGPPPAVSERTWAATSGVREASLMPSASSRRSGIRRRSRIVGAWCGVALGLAALAGWIYLLAASVTATPTREPVRYPTRPPTVVPSAAEPEAAQIDVLMQQEQEHAEPPASAPRKQRPRARPVEPAPAVEVPQTPVPPPVTEAATPAPKDEPAREAPAPAAPLVPQPAQIKPVF